MPDALPVRSPCVANEKIGELGLSGVVEMPRSVGVDDASELHTVVQITARQIAGMSKRISLVSVRPWTAYSNGPDHDASCRHQQENCD
jgi:hypothetical protein